MDTNKFNEAMIAASIRAKDTGEKCYVFRIPPDDERLYVASTQEIERYPGNAHEILQYSLGNYGHDVIKFLEAEFLKRNDQGNEN